MKPQRLQIDFVQRRRVHSKAGMAMLAVALLAAGGALYQLADVAALNARMASTLQAVEARRGAPASLAKASAKPNARELARTRAVRQVSQRLTTPWAELLDSLESAPSRSVAILSIEPSVSKHSVRITAEAKTSADMLGYLTALQQEPRLSSAVLVSHQVQAQTPGTPVRFQVQAGWGMGE